MPSVHTTHHAVQRYQQRVDPQASYAEAKLALGRLVALGRHRPTPRWWMRGQISCGPGVRFCYFAERPHLCAVIVDGAVVTVLTRSMFGGPRRPSGPLHVVEAHTGRPAPAAERARWRWNGQIDRDAA